MFFRESEKCKSKERNTEKSVIIRSIVFPLHHRISIDFEEIFEIDRIICHQITRLNKFIILVSPKTWKYKHKKSKGVKSKIEIRFHNGPNFDFSDDFVRINDCIKTLHQLQIVFECHFKKITLNDMHKICDFVDKTVIKMKSTILGVGLGGKDLQCETFENTGFFEKSLNGEQSTWLCTGQESQKREKETSIYGR